MADLRYTEKELRERAYPAEPSVNRNDHPYGCKISLTERELALLEVDKDDVPKVGDLMHFSAMARLTYYSDHETNGRCAELEIVEMLCMEDENEEGEEDGDND